MKVRRQYLFVLDDGLGCIPVDTPIVDLDTSLDTAVSAWEKVRQLLHLRPLSPGTGLPARSVGFITFPKSHPPSPKQCGCSFAEDESNE